MITISLCIIVKNEADLLSRCLESVKDAVDEIVVVDTGSTDNTRETARQYTDQVFDFQWIDDFSAARNFSFAKATQEYILWLDADDVLKQEDACKLADWKRCLSPSVDSVTMIYHYAFDEYGNPTISFRRNRLVRRARQFQWHGPVHEYLAVHGEIRNSDIVVTHLRAGRQSNRNLDIFEKRLARGESFSPRDLYYYGNELMDHQCYERAAPIYQRFLETGKGWVEDVISACSKLADIYHRIGNEEMEMHYILKSFDYDCPRAESCCRMGLLFMKQAELRRAVFWFDLATQVERPRDSWGFMHDAYWTWVPHVQLCICHYRLGDYQRSWDHNETARRYRPDDEYILHNRRLLEGILSHDAIS